MGAKTSYIIIQRKDRRNAGYGIGNMRAKLLSSITFRLKRRLSLITVLQTADKSNTLPRRVPPALQR